MKVEIILSMNQKDFNDYQEAMELLKEKRKKEFPLNPRAGDMFNNHVYMCGQWIDLEPLVK